MDMEKFKREFGQRVREARVAKGMTQEELAQKLGYSDNGKGMISKIENGKVEPPISKLFSLASILNTSIVYLMGWDREIAITQPENAVAQTWMSEEEATLLMSFRMLNETGKHAALAMVNGMSLDDRYLQKRKTE